MYNAIAIEVSEKFTSINFLLGFVRLHGAMWNTDNAGYSKLIIRKIVMFLFLLGDFYLLTVVSNGY